MPILILVLFLLNVFDLVSTLYLIRTGLGYEANPIMAYFLDIGEWALITAKLGIVIPGCLLLYKYRATPTTKWSTAICIVLYSILMLHHLTLIYTIGG